MSIALSLSGKYFSANVPDVIIDITGTSAAVTMAVDGEKIYSETLYPVGNTVTLSELGDLLRPYARKRLVVAFAITVSDRDADGKELQNGSASCSVVYCEADVDLSAESWCESRFLTLLDGTKTTAMGRLEYLHYIGSGSSSVHAVYEDGSSKDFDTTAIGGNDNYTTIDVSPNRFAEDGKTLSAYTVTVGSRNQRFVIDQQKPDCAPVLLFSNSFGCEELLYCTGKETFSGGFKYDNARIAGRSRNYKITETRSFKADTGILSFAMAAWCQDMLRSDSVRIVNFKGGAPQVGREVVVSDPKVEYTNEADELPRVTFTIQYAQRNHNVVDTGRAGRVFDNTFDYTFE